MPRFALINNWNIPAPIERCWFSIVDAESWPSWWPYVEKVEELEAGDRLGVDNKRRYHWRTCLPYTLTFELQVTQVEPYQLIHFVAKGDLHGEGCCRFTAKENSTMIQFEWHVETCKPWMNRLPDFFTPVSKWNHSRVMTRGEKNLIKRLEP